MSYARWSSFHVLTWLVTASIAWSDDRLSGGETTVFVTNDKAFARPLANISRLTRRQHTVGNSFFNQNWVASPASTTSRDGLGHLFNARSCSACHVRDGRAEPPGNGEFALGLVMRISLPGRLATGGPVPDPSYGLQVSERALPGLKAEGHVRVSYDEVDGTYPDGGRFSLRRPTYKIVDLGAGPLNSKTRFSPRVAPAVHGLGLLAAVEEGTLRALEDPGDRDGDGISGKLNMVWDYEGKRLVPGRFGWKANQPSLRQQTAGAFVGDLGITSPLFPEENHTAAYAELHNLGDQSEDQHPELSAKILQRVTAYLETLAPPARRNVDDPVVRQGQRLFARMNCASCHTPELRTGNDYPLVELRDQTIRPYTDLLLHDMGEGLADGREDFEANGQEWRTPPLWGVGLQERVNGHTMLLHDGRARNLTEAILWHGGEAEKSRELFLNSTSKERSALLSFLQSL
ncbi:MAG TPA: thiol oxidoreductase [Verrucomicrobiales bacterium]|nr:thiol oxidoreductase [Verrucomicrobiales bacterium]|tara:strand:+ start:2629 stop:4008 length:1380 start_codon:yes stop_codon:yes gene_type:complete